MAEDSGWVDSHMFLEVEESPESKGENPLNAMDRLQEYFHFHLKELQLVSLRCMESVRQISHMQLSSSPCLW